jgi:hypothetical protein
MWTGWRRNGTVIFAVKAVDQTQAMTNRAGYKALISSPRGQEICEKSNWMSYCLCGLIFRITIFEVGVLLLSAVLLMGTSTLVSGK